MALVADVLQEEYSVKGIPVIASSASIRERSAVALELLSARCKEVTRYEAKPGDIVLVRVGSLPAHVGILVTPTTVMHYPTDDIGVVIESLDSPWLKNRIAGFYRPVA
jgi:cell wall-associated NlpC family hydrolase